MLPAGACVPTKGGPVAGRHPGADRAAGFVYLLRFTAGAPRTVTERAVVPWHHASRPAIASPRPAWNCSTPGRAQRHHQPYRTHLGISPGNLYYHYPNSRRSSPSCSRVRSHVESFLRLPKGGSDGGRQDLLLEALLAAMWRYRFSTATSSTCWKATGAGGALPRFAQRCLVNAKAIYRASPRPASCG